jgi:hypothetical protein
MKSSYLDLLFTQSEEILHILESLGSLTDISTIYHKSIDLRFLLFATSLANDLLDVLSHVESFKAALIAQCHTSEHNRCVLTFMLFQYLCQLLGRLS